MLDKSLVNIPEKFRDHPLFNELICGMNFGFMAKRGYYETPFALEQPALMQKAGVNWTTVNMNFCQTHYFSRKSYLDFEFSTGEIELLEIVKLLHEHGVKVLFKPCLTPLDGAWMGDVRFPTDMKQIAGVDVSYWDEWFKSFTEGAKYFASLATKIGADALLIGAEYFGTENKDAYWRKVIEEVRKYYDGPISYEFTPSSTKSYKLNWFDGLDFLSYSYYPAASPAPEGLVTTEMGSALAEAMPDRTMEQMKEFLAPQRDFVTELCERFDNKPLAFTEYGCRASHGCSMNPSNYLWDSHYDGKEQADYMEASFRTFWDIPSWMGFFWWKWDETQLRPHYHNDPNGEKGFTIQGKPAEEVMRRWMSKNK